MDFYDVFILTFYVYKFLHFFESLTQQICWFNESCPFLLSFFFVVAYTANRTQNHNVTLFILKLNLFTRCVVIWNINNCGEFHVFKHKFLCFIYVWQRIGFMFINVCGYSRRFYFFYLTRLFCTACTRNANLKINTARIRLIFLYTNIYLYPRKIQKLLNCIL